MKFSQLIEKINKQYEIYKVVEKYNTKKITVAEDEIRKILEANISTHNLNFKYTEKIDGNECYLMEYENERYYISKKDIKKNNFYVRGMELIPNDLYVKTYFGNDFSKVINLQIKNNKFFDTKQKEILKKDYMTQTVMY